MKLARRLGYAPDRSPDPVLALQQDYQAHIQGVRQAYDHLLREPPSEEEEIPSHPLADFLDGRADEGVVREPLAAAGVLDLDGAVRTLLVLRDGPPFRHTTAGTRRILATLAPTLMEGVMQARIRTWPSFSVSGLSRGLVPAAASTTFSSKRRSRWST